MHANGHGLRAAATFSNKATNQDAFALATNAHMPLAGVIVADGLGSHYGAEVAASTVAAALCEGIEQARVADELDFRHLFMDAWSRLVARVDADGASLPADLDWKNAFGTTAICAVETAHDLQLAYTGNGGIFHLRGNFNRFPASQPAAVERDELPQSAFDPAKRQECDVQARLRTLRTRRHRAERHSHE